MSKVVTQGFIDAWNAKYGKNGRVYVQYKKRYWNGAAYVYDSAWTNLTMRQFSVAGQVIMKLDTPLLNTVKSSNVSIKLKNTDYQWLGTNITTGIFKADATATAGYEPFLTMFRVQFGYKKTSGIFELVNLFTGVAIDFVFDTSSAEVEVVVSGNEYLLQAADAQLVSDAFSAESCSPATGDGANKTFLTTSVGISYINSKTGVTDAGTNQIQGVDYTLANVGVYNTPATITFVVAPTAGHAIKATGRKWKTLLKIEELVALICTQAGIGAGQRSISPAIFPGGLSASNTWDTESDFEAGTVGLSINTRGTPGQIMLFSDLYDDFSGTLAKWTSVDTSSGGYSISGGMMVFASSLGQGFAKTCAAQPAAYGDMSFDYRLMSEPTGVNTIDKIAIISTTQDNADGAGNGYYFHIERNNPGHAGKYFIQLRKFTGGTGGTTTTLIGFTFTNIDTLVHTLRVTRTNAGLFEFFFDGVSQGTATDTTYTTSAYFAAFVHADNNQTTAAAIDNVTFNHVLSDTWVSAVYDMITPTAIGIIQNTTTVPANTSLTIATQTSASNSPFNDPDGWVAVGAGNQVMSAVRQYIKIRYTFTRTGAYNITPQVDLVKLDYTVVSIQLAMADFSGDTCFSAIQKLAQLCDYEWGFDGDGNLFFRSKTVSGSPVVVINQSRAIAKIVDFRPGFDAVLNDGQVTYGQYYSEYNSGSLPETGPTSQARFLTRVRSDDYSNFLLAHDVNIADGRAQLIHDNNYLPRRRARLKGKIIPQLDLSDIITVSYFDRPILKDNIFGDPLQKWPATFGTPTNVLLRSVNFKIIGITVDPVACTGEYDIQEVL